MSYRPHPTAVKSALKYADAQRRATKGKYKPPDVQLTDLAAEVRGLQAEVRGLRKRLRSEPKRLRSLAIKAVKDRDKAVEDRDRWAARVKTVEQRAEDAVSALTGVNDLEWPNP